MADATDGKGRGRRLWCESARLSSRSSATWSIDTRHLQTHCAQPFPHGAGETLHQLVAEVVIDLAFVSQASRVDPEDADELGSAGIECPTIGRHQPRSVEDLTLPQRSYDKWLLTGGMQLEGHSALP